MTSPGRVLVTGGGGFVGRHAVPALIARGYEVHVAGRTLATNLPASVTVHCADLFADGAATRLVNEVKPSHLLHLVWNVTPGAFWTALENLDWVAASLNLFRAFAEQGGKRLVAAGSCAEYDWTHDWLDEAGTPLRPQTLYGAAKNALRELLEATAPQTGVSVAWGRVFFLYGPHEGQARLVPYVVNSLLAGKAAQLSDGHQERDFMHVFDAARAFAMLIDSDVEGAVNVASGDCRPLRGIVELIARDMNAPNSMLEFGARPTPAGDPPRLAANVSILRDRVGFTPEYDLRAGLAQSIGWWREQA